MSEEEILEEIIKIMKANSYCEDESKITMETSIMDDLDIDSLDIVELILEIEERYEISIEDDAVQNFITIKDLVDYIKKQLD